MSQPPKPAALVLTPRRLFVLFGVLAAVAIVGFRAQSLLLERERVLQQRATQAATLAQFAATYSARLYDQSARVAEEVAEYVRDQDPSVEALHAFLAARAADTTANDYIVVLDETGRVRATSEASRPAAAAFGGPGFAARWSQTEEEIVPVLRSRISGAPIYSLSRRLTDRQDTFRGVVGVNVRPDGIRPTAERKPGDAMLTVWGQDGRFIAASFLDFDAQGRPVAPRPPPGVGIPGSARPVERIPLAAGAPVQGWPLVAAASYEESGVLAPWRRSVYETLALLTLMLAGIGALVWLGVKTADRETTARAALQDANDVAASALRDRDLLLKEVHHRVKNSLLMTAGLLYLQERRFSDPEVREAFESTRRRLNSISLVHEALYSGSSSEEVNLADYLKRLLDEIAEAYGAEARGITLATTVEPLMVAASQATPIGLIVTEVVTNAFKHAFEEGSAGRISVSAKLVNLDEIQVEVRDDGRGYASVNDATPSGGLGTRLIRNLTEQLSGVLSLANEEGAAFRLTFPRSARR